MVAVGCGGGRVDQDDVLGVCADGLVVQQAPVVQASQGEQQGVVFFQAHVRTLEQDQEQLWSASLVCLEQYVDYDEAASDVDVVHWDVQEGGDDV